MKIYKKIRISIDSGETLEEDSYEYTGQLALCGSGGSTSTVDKLYNAGLLKLAEQNQGWAGELFNVYKYGVTYNPNEIVNTSVWKDSNGATVDLSRYDGVKWEGGRAIDKYGNDMGIFRHATTGVITGDPNLPAGIRYMNNGSWLDSKKKPLQIVSSSSMTRGEKEGYVADDHVSEMEYNDNVLNSKNSLLAGETSAAAATNSATEQKAITDEQQAIADRSLIESDTAAKKATNDFTTADALAAIGLIPGRTKAEDSTNALIYANNTADLGLVDARAAADLSGFQLAAGTNQANIDLLGTRKSVADKYYKEALAGVNVTNKINQASADIANSYENAQTENRMMMANMGVNPNSGYAGSMDAISKAKGIGLAKSIARTTAEDANFNRLQSAIGAGGL